MKIIWFYKFLNSRLYFDISPYILDVQHNVLCLAITNSEGVIATVRIFLRVITNLSQI